MSIIAIDPGKITGIATWSQRTETFERFEMSEQEVYTWLRGITPALHIWVIEAYTVTARTAQLSQQLEALYIIGAVRYKLSNYGMLPLMRPPSDKRFATDAKLKALGFWSPSAGGHANDAARHLLNYLVRDLRSAPHLEALKEFAR